MNITISFPEGTKTKQILDVLMSLEPLEEKGYVFDVVIGEPAPPTPLPRFETPIPGTPDIPGVPAAPPVDLDDLESLIGKPLPGSEVQDDPSLRRRAIRAADQD